MRQLKSLANIHGEASGISEELTLLSVREVCAISGFGRTKIYEEIAAKRLLSITIGKQRRIRVSAARTWMEGRK